MSHDIDLLELQRLVEGRLPVDERAALLAWADAHPGNWKRIAFAFVEEQTLSEQLRPPAVAQTSATPTGDRQKLTTRLTAAVALIAAAFFGGIAGRLSMLAESPVLVKDSTTSAEARDAIPPTDPTYVVLMPDENPSPLPAAGTLWDDAIEMMSTPVFDRQLQDQLLTYGFAAVERPMLYLVADDSGDNYVIPQREVSLVSLQDEPANSNPQITPPFQKVMP